MSFRKTDLGHIGGTIALLLAILSCSDEDTSRSLSPSAARLFGAAQ